MFILFYCAWWVMYYFGGFRQSLDVGTISKSTPSSAKRKDINTHTLWPSAHSPPRSRRNSGILGIWSICMYEYMFCELRFRGFAVTRSVVIHCNFLHSLLVRYRSKPILIHCPAGICFLFGGRFTLSRLPNY